MSLGNGNAKNGDKGSNFDFELKSLKGFQKIIDSLVTYERTPNIVRATGIGTIAPVVYSFSVSNVGAANGTILGATIKPGETFNFSPELNNYYDANSITYDGTGTELVIIYNS